MKGTLDSKDNGGQPIYEGQSTGPNVGWIVWSFKVQTLFGPVKKWSDLGRVLILQGWIASGAGGLLQGWIGTLETLEIESTLHCSKLKAKMVMIKQIITQFETVDTTRPKAQSSTKYKVIW